MATAASRPHYHRLGSATGHTTGGIFEDPPGGTRGGKRRRAFSRYGNIRNIGSKWVPCRPEGVTYRYRGYRVEIYIEGGIGVGYQTQVGGEGKIVERAKRVTEIVHSMGGLWDPNHLPLPVSIVTSRFHYLRPGGRLSTNS